MGTSRHGRAFAMLFVCVCPLTLAIVFGGCNADQSCDLDSDCANGSVCVAGACTSDSDFSAGVDKGDLLDMGIADVPTEPDGLGGSGESTDIGAEIDTFCGISAYQNGSNYKATHGNSLYGYNYQCTELAYRFLCQHYALCEKKVGKYGNAKVWYDNPKNDPVLAKLERHPNGGTEPPRPGDAIIWKTGTYGHVAIVKAVGGGFVNVIEQNVYYGSHVYKLTESSGTYSIPNTYGWMRAPNSQPACGATPGDNPATATLTAPIQGTNWTGAFQVSGQATDIDGLAKVTVTLNDKKVVVCDANCPGTTQGISSLVDPASLGVSNGSIAVAVWVRDVLGNEYGPLSVRTIQWQNASSSPVCGNGTCESGETCSNCVQDCACGSGQTCQNNVCIGCSNQCSQGQSQCSGQTIQSCASQNGCWVWQNTQTCTSPQICQVGQCVNNCTNQCSPGQTTCSGQTVQNCGSVNGCWVWQNVQTCVSPQICQGGQCVNNCSYQTTNKVEDYTCGGGTVMNVNGVLDASGNLSVSATKLDGTTFGSGDYYVWVFDPNDGIPSNHCKQFNVQKGHITVGGTNPSSISFPSFSSLLTCGGPAKGYCVTKAAGGDNAWFGSRELVATYQ